VIAYPTDSEVVDEASSSGIPEPVLIRDIIRIVEVLNLKAQGFFGKRSVLAGSMALRCFQSPRFTVYDADFSTTTETVYPETKLKKLLTYHDEFVDVEVEALFPHDAKGTTWLADPVTYDAGFTALVPNREDRRFKADVSFRGVLLDGLERSIAVPYDLGLWKDPPLVWVMNPHEAVAEKVLGWCAHRELKHYADLGFIAMEAQKKDGDIVLDDNLLRETLDGKLRVMANLQPDNYQAFPNIDALIVDLAAPVAFPKQDWQKIMYVKSAQGVYQPKLLSAAVEQLLVPRFQ
jgi:hypothetical protein